MLTIFIQIRMKGIIIRTKRTGLVCSLGQVGINIRGTTSTMKERGLARCVGQTAAFTKENGSEGSNMVRAK